MPLSVDGNTSKKSSLADVRALRRQLAERIQTGWEYPPCPRSHPYPENTGQTTTRIPLADLLKGDYSASNTLAERQGADYTINDERVLGWQERTIASSDPSSDEQGNQEVWEATEKRSQVNSGRSPKSSVDVGSSSLGSRLLRGKEKLKSVSKRLSLSDDSQLLSPDAMNKALRLEEEQAEQVREASRRRYEKKQRRRRRLEEEMGWNEGLAFWVRRRDAWCCAKTVECEDSSLKTSGFSNRRSEESILTDVHDNAILPVNDIDRVQDESLDHTALDLGIFTRSNQDRTSTSSSTTVISSVGSASTTLTVPPTVPSEIIGSKPDATTLVPLVAPILPTTDPTRSSLGPSLYPSIYSKTVLQSLTPSVPINLSHMVPALVDGWKRDGEWPTPGIGGGVTGIALPSGPLGNRKGATAAVRRRRPTREISTAGAFAHAVESRGLRTDSAVRGKIAVEAPLVKTTQSPRKRQETHEAIPPQRPSSPAAVVMKDVV